MNLMQIGHNAHCLFGVEQMNFKDGSLVFCGRRGGDKCF